MSLRGGRFELLGVIATGGMATVHLGRALGAGGFERVVAIKTMHPHLACEPEFVAMFLDEARLAARIRHPNVVATLDIQQDEEGLFLVMELVEGPSLSHLAKALAKRQQKLPLDVALRIALDFLAGLHAAHELTGPAGEPLHLIHRDMSPHNVLVGADGISRITDFGVARAESRLSTTRSGSVKGKVMYMPPEQVRSEPVDRRADIYAAGAVLWEMLTGQRLIRGDSDLARMHEILHAPRKPAHEVAPAVPEPLSRACARALEPDRELRFPTAAAFAEALEKTAAESGVAPAAPRVVGALVRDLGVHFVPRDLPPPSVPAAIAARAPLASAPGFAGAPLASPPGFAGAPVASAVPPRAPLPSTPGLAGVPSALLPSVPLHTGPPSSGPPSSSETAQPATDTRAVFAAPPPTGAAAPAAPSSAEPAAPAPEPAAPPPASTATPTASASASASAQPPAAAGQGLTAAPAAPTKPPPAAPAASPAARGYRPKEL